MYRFGEPACHRWKRQGRSLALVSVFLLLLFFSGVVGKEGKDLYKILGVDKQASQADIKKAFHKLSLKYHPDKNPSKDAQVKFTEISNAYDVLSDEQKRTNYDTYGDPAGPTGPTGGPRGWSSSGGRGFTFESQPHFTFSYGGDGGGGGSGGFGNIFETFFEGGSNFGGFQGGRNQGNSQGQRGTRSSLFDSMEGVEKFSGPNFRKQVIDKGKLTWLVLFYNPHNQNLQPIASALKEVVSSLGGMIKVGVIDCQAERNVCGQEGALPLQDARAFVYPYGGSDPGQYTGVWTAKSLKNFVVTHLPKKSTRLDTGNFLQLYPDYHVLPRVLLLTKKKETPAMWRALSGIYDNQVAFFDAQVDDELDPLATRFNVKIFPAVVGVMSNGKESILAGKEDLEGTRFKIEDLKGLIDRFRKESKEAGSRQGGSQSEGEVPFLSKSNFGLVCGEDTPMCIFAVVKSAKHADKTQQIITEVSRKTLVRQVDSYGMKKTALSYSLVDASKQSSFLQAFGSPKFPKSDTLLLAYKAKRKRFAIFKGALTLEEVEGFVTGALGGDVHFDSCKKSPVLSL